MASEIKVAERTTPPPGRACRPLRRATCHFYLQQVDDPDKLRAIIPEMAADLTN